MNGQKIQIYGMKCVSCQSSVQQCLKRIGLKNIQIDYLSGWVVFDNPSKVHDNKINHVIKGLGYSLKKPQNKSLHYAFNWLFCFSIAMLFWINMFFHFSWLDNYIVQLILSLPVFILVAIKIGYSGLKSAVKLYPNMNFLIFMGCSAAFIYSIYLTFFISNPPHVFYETAVSIAAFVFLGRWMEHKALMKVYDSVNQFNHLQPNTVSRVVGDKVIKAPAEDIAIGDIIQIVEGDKIPTDGIITAGELWLDESILTGESVWVHKKKSSKVIAGAINKKGAATLTVTAGISENTIASIIQLVDKAKDCKPKIQQLGDRISNTFVWAILGIAIVVFLLLYFVVAFPFDQAMMNTITVLVIACPCAVGLATPTAISVGVERLTKKNFLIKRSDALENIYKADFFLFDKTGTLTDGKFSLKQIQCLDGQKEQAIKSIIIALEKAAKHPIGQSLLDSLQNQGVVPMPMLRLREEKSKGVRGEDLQGNEYFIGTHQGSQDFNLTLQKNKKDIAYIKIEDQIKQAARQVFQDLRKKGITPVMISGDKKHRCINIAEKIGLDQKYVFAECRADEKIKIVQNFQSKGIVVMFGDGLNDAAALKAAHAGVSFANINDWTSAQADIIIPNPSLKEVSSLYRYSKSIYRTILKNFIWAIAYNIVAVPMAALGFFTPTLGALFMAFSDILVVGNSLLLRRKIK